jgi:hypothetical protein
LLQLVNEIKTCSEFPLTTDERRCRYCVYRSLNDRGREAGSLAGWDQDKEPAEADAFTIDLDEINEIEF